jgi:Tol biopolymer transport system component
VDNAGAASVSPDGLLVTFSRRDPERQTADIWLVGANGESPHRIRAASEHQGYFGPVWSSNGQHLFYLRGGRDVKGGLLESCDIRGEQVTTIFSPKENQDLNSLCWAPDGRILFSLAEVGLRSSIWNLWEIKVDMITGKPMVRRDPLPNGLALILRVPTT